MTNENATVKVFIEHIPGAKRSWGWKHEAYNVRLADTGELIVTLARDPECAACRALMVRGITGTLETWREGEPYASGRWNIAKYAALTCSESDTRGPEFVPYRPFVRDADDTPTPAEISGYHTDKAAMTSGEALPDGTPILSPERFEQLSALLDGGASGLEE